MSLSMLMFWMSRVLASSYSERAGMVAVDGFCGSMSCKVSPRGSGDDVRECGIDDGMSPLSP